MAQPSPLASGEDGRKGNVGAMSFSRLPLALGLALAAPLALAASPVGSWTGKITAKMPPMPANMPAQQKAMMAQVMGQMAKVRIMLNLKADKTFTVATMGMPQAPQKKETGKWSQKGNVVTMTDANAKMGAKSQDFMLSPDGKTMTLALPGGRGKVVFTR